MAAIMEIVEELHSSFDTVADQQKKKWMQNYMRNQFLFFGIPAPVRKKIQKQWIDRFLSSESEFSVSELIRHLYKLDQREFQYVAVDLLDRYAHTLSDLERLDILQECIMTKSWWDTVDILATSVAGKWLYKNKADQINITTRWGQSDHIWLRRTAIIHQIRYRAETDFEILSYLIGQSAQIRNFFIQKAIGWALREYSKSEPVLVSTFVYENEKELTPLAKREALKWLANKS